MTDSRVEVAGGWGQGAWKLLVLEGPGVSAPSRESILETDGGDSHTTLGMQLMPLDYTLKNKGSGDCMCLLPKLLKNGIALGAKATLVSH